MKDMMTLNPYVASATIDGKKLGDTPTKAKNVAAAANDVRITPSLPNKSSDTVEIYNFIGGQWKLPSTSQFLESTSPITGKVTAQVPASSNVDMDAGIAAAKAAFPAWSAQFPSHRAEYMIKLARLIEEHLDLLVHFETLDTGTLYKFNRNENVEMCIKSLRELAGYATNKLTRPAARLVSADHGFIPESEKIRDVINLTYRAPIGVCVTYSPCTV